MSYLKHHLFRTLQKEEKTNEWQAQHKTQEMVLIAGPILSGKTSILFTMACKAANSGAKVLFLTDKEQLYKNLPCTCIYGQDSFARSPEPRSPLPYLSNIEMK